eukprot:8791279-Lingulodinium_polyedra.AAC.1
MFCSLRPAGQPSGQVQWGWGGICCDPRFCAAALLGSRAQGLRQGRGGTSWPVFLRCRIAGVE